MEEEKDILPSDEELDKSDSVDLLSSKEILEDIKKEEEKRNKLKEEKSKRKEPLSEKDFSFDEEENIEPDVDTEGDDKKKGLLLDIHDDDELSEKEEDKKVKDRDFSTEMAIASIVAGFFSFIVFLIKIFNFSSVMGLIFTTLMFFIIWFGVTMLVFFLMYSNFPKIYMLFFKMDEKLSTTSGIVAGGEDDENLKSDYSSDESVLGDGAAIEDLDLPSSEKPVFGGPTAEETTQVGDFNFSFDNKDMAKAVRSMISDEEPGQDKKE